MNRIQCVLAALFLGLVHLQAAEEKLDLRKLPAASAEKIDFARHIQPILVRACVSCHGAEKQKGGLRLDSAEGLLKGSNAGPVLKTGDSVRSRLIHVVSGLDPETKMPPNGKMLTGQDVGLLRAWIDQGGTWPKNLRLVAAAEKKATHWAFIPPVRPAIPKTTNNSWVRNEIDSFVFAGLAAEKFQPSPEADRFTLMRRVYLDLLGLLPSPREVDDYMKDTRPDAYERLVDRLLQSPHYGERWGRHWLDLARYADTDGYEKDNPRPFAWRYRNWVIDAINRDLPFDQFAIEQLAGDLIPHATLDQKIATGFHRNTLTNTEGGTDKEQFRVEACVDRVNTTAKVFLGLTMGCAQCHDHKYDPFSQREYYQFFAFFNSDTEVNIPAPLSEEIEPDNQKKAIYDKKLAELQAAVAAYSKTELAANQQKWENELKLPELRKLPPALSALLVLEPAKRDEKQKKEVTDYYAKVDKKLVALNKAVADHQKTAPVQTQAQTLSLGGFRKTHVMIRGDFLRPGVEVDLGTPAALSPSAEKQPPPHQPKAAQPTRMDLAKWLTDSANPLTARVITNWIWHHYFGRGIVATLEDFGTQGEKPSHPELLDWLATEFIKQKWSMKAFHKLIVTSATYRQSSNARPELTMRDPLNILLSRQNRPRLEAEVIRDLSLTASGLLNRKLGGPSVRPPQPAGISELTYAGSAKWVESQGPDRYRRGMYTWFQRTSPYPMLVTFDAPDANLSCVRRDRSNTPLQALTLLNDPVFFECAQAMGKRILTEATGTTQDKVKYAVKLCVSREPTATELARLGQLFTDLLQTCQSNPEASAKLLGNYKPTNASAPEAAAWIGIARAIMNLDEFVTRN